VILSGTCSSTIQCSNIRRSLTAFPSRTVIPFAHWVRSKLYMFTGYQLHLIRGSGKRGIRRQRLHIILDAMITPGKVS